jgi:hypothetical protein
MERSGPAFFEEDDDETDFDSSEVSPKKEDEEPSVVEKLKKIMGIEEDGAEVGKKGIFERLAGESPEVVEVDQTEESPQETESHFSLPILEAPDAEKDKEEEPLVEPHHVEPVTVDPEVIPVDDAEDSIRREQPLQQQATREVEEPVPEVAPEDEDPEPITLPTPFPPAVPMPPVPEMSIPTPELDTDDFATHREASRKAVLAGAAGVGAAIIANSKAKRREHTMEQKSLKRDEDLSEKIERQQRQTEITQANLRRELESNQQPQPGPERTPVAPVEVPPEVSQKAEQAPLKEEDRRKSPSEQAPRPQPLQEKYSPDVHDRIPPKVAFEQLTGIEQPLPRTLEQERRHEVKDVASKTPVSYTQIDPQSPWHQPQSQSPQSARSTLMGLGSNSTTPLDHQLPARTPSHPYKKAIVSGAVTAAVILSAFAVFMLLS